MSSFDEMMAVYKKQEQEKQACQRGQRGKARQLLFDLLKFGPVSVKTIRMQAMLKGISWRTIKRAKAWMEITSISLRSDNKIIGWEWELNIPLEQSRVFK